MSKVPLWLKAISAIAWAVMSGYAAYLFIRTGEQIFSSIQQYAPIIGIMMSMMVAMLMLYPIITLITTIVKGVKG